MKAVEILTSGICPLNCKYCYIPKTGKMKELHEEIVSKLDSYPELVKSYYGIDLEYLSFWGTEPTLTISKLGIEKFFEMFPKLQNISISTNMMLSPDILISFIKKLNAVDRAIIFDCQVSLDGPAAITDRNRGKGVTKKIISNLKRLTKELQKIELNKLEIKMRWKPTLTRENLLQITFPQKIDEYDRFFNKLNEELKELNTQKNVELNRGYTATLEVPGKYTSEDGKLFAKYVKLNHVKGLPTAYDFRLKRLLDFETELGPKRCMFTCSGGDSQFGIGMEGELHLCHRSFYLNRPEYVQSVMESGVENWDVSKFDEGYINELVKNYIANSDDITRLKYVMRSYHDFWRMQIAYGIAMLKELARCGQVEAAFKDNNDLCVFFSIYLATALSCPEENILNTGVLQYTPLSLFRMFGNGAFTELVKYELGKRK